MNKALTASFRISIKEKDAVNFIKQETSEFEIGGSHSGFAEYLAQR
jgi:hypothetical protein